MFYNVLRCRIVRFRLHLPFPDAQLWTSIDHSVTCETKIRGRFMTIIRNSRVQMPNQRKNCFVLHKLISGLLQWYSCKSFHNTSKYMNGIEKSVDRDNFLTIKYFLRFVMNLQFAFKISALTFFSIQFIYLLVL